LQVLNKIGLLHALSVAMAADGRRPSNSLDVDFLDLSGSALTDSGLKELKTLSDLRTLHLGGTAVTVNGLQELLAFRKLESLSLDPAQLSDATLRRLRQLNLLHVLRQASGTMAKAKKRPSGPSDVVHFRLDNSPITDDGLEELADFNNLQTLVLSNTA